MQAVLGVKAQGLGRQSQPTGQGPPGQAALHGAQCQRLRTSAQADLNLNERQVGDRTLPLALHHIGPGADGAGALLQIDPKGDIPAQLRQVNPLKGAVNLAVPSPPASALHRQQGLQKTSGHAEALAPGGRWRGVQAQLVAATDIANHQLHLTQRQGWRSTQLIGPVDAATLDHPLAL